MEPNTLSDSEAMVYLSIMLFVYLLPTVIAYGRGTHNRLLIFAINLLFGWSGFGWIITFVMSIGSLTEEELDRKHGSVNQIVTVVVHKDTPNIQKESSAQLRYMTEEEYQNACLPKLPVERK